MEELKHQIGEDLSATEHLYDSDTADEIEHVEKLLQEHIIKSDSEKAKLQEFIDRLAEIREVLKYADVAEVRLALRTEMAEDRDSIITEFKKSFGTLPDNDTFKKNVLVLLGDLGITVCWINHLNICFFYDHNIPRQKQQQKECLFLTL